MSQGVELIESDTSLKVEIHGRLFTEYHYRNVPRPYFYPVIGPTGEPMTRHWPMAEAPNEKHDHPHHRSLWFTHGDVNGHDFWSEKKGHGRIVHQRFLKKSDRTIQTENQWISHTGDIVCTDTRTMRFTPLDNRQVLMDFDITLHASHGPVVLGDTKEGSMAIRVAPSMRVEGEIACGHLVNSAGQRDGQCWGQRATWCDSHGPINGKIVGVAIFDHPDNPRHPTWWHARKYGLLTANPFGLHYFEEKPKGTGNLTIEKGSSLTLRYRLYFHLGDEKTAHVAQRYKDYAGITDHPPVGYNKI